MLILVLLGMYFDAVVVVGVVSLLLFRLPMAILCVAMRLSRSEAGSSFLFGVSSHRSRNGLFA